MQQLRTPTPWASLPLDDDELAPPAAPDDYVPVGAHLVGSVPLAGAEEVFRAGAGALGARMPDGETGPRSDWILWQYPVFSSRPQFEVGPPGLDSYRTLPKLRLRSGESAAGVTFENLGYADAAISSYRQFARLKRDGVIPSHVRFQLSLPTPLAPITAFMAPEHRALIEPPYEAAVLRESTSGAMTSSATWRAMPTTRRGSAPATPMSSSCTTRSRSASS